MLIGNITVDTSHVSLEDSLSVKCFDALEYFKTNPIDPETDVLISDDIHSLIGLMENLKTYDAARCFDIDIELGRHENEYLFIGNKNEIEETLPCEIKGLKENVLYSVLWRLKHK